MKNKREAAKLLARVIDERTIEVRDALFDSGVKISPNADKEELVDAVVDNFGMNKRLQRKIGGLALELQPNILDQIPAKFRGQSGNNNKLSPEAKETLLDTGGQVVGLALANFLSNRQARQQAEIEQQLLEAQAQSDLANAELVKQQLLLQGTQNINKASMTPSMRLFTGVLIVGALGTAYYFYMKSQKAEK